MNRRQFLGKTAGKAALVGTSAIAAPQVLTAAKKKTYRWRLVMVIPKTLPIWGEQVQAFARKVKTISEGRLQIKVYGAGELVPALGTFDAVKSGQVQMASSAAYYWIGKIPEAGFFTTVPFGMSTTAVRAWLATEGQQLWDELYSPHGVLALPGGNTGTQMGGWFNKEIKSIADFKGLKMRMPGLGGKVLAKAGGKPVLVPGNEIYTNLATGVVDAIEWIGPYHDYVMGFHKIAKFYYYPGWQEPGATIELMFNKKALEDLPGELQTLVRSCAAELDHNMHTAWSAKDADYLQKIKNETTVKILGYPSDVLIEFEKIASVIKEQVAATSPLGRKILDSYQRFQSNFAAFEKMTQQSLNYVSPVKSEVKGS